MITVVSGTGAPIVLSECGNNITAIALDDTRVFWSSSGAGEIDVTAKGDPFVGNCHAASFRTLAQNEMGASDLALAGDSVVWTNPTTGNVRLVPKSGTCNVPPCQRTLASSQARPVHVAADAKAAYWLNDGDHTIWGVGL